MASFASDSAGELVVLLVCNGMEAGNLCAVIEALQASSKDCGTHKRRELYWAAYGGFLKHLSGVEGDVAALLSYRAPAEGGGEDGATELVALTKRQRHMLQQGGLELMGKKLKPPDDPDGRSWAICYGEDDAARALDDLTAAEPCVWATAASVYVGTRLKRRLCKHLSAPWKTPKELEAGLQARRAHLCSLTRRPSSERRACRRTAGRWREGADVGLLLRRPSRPRSSPSRSTGTRTRRRGSSGTTFFSPARAGGNRPPCNRSTPAHRALSSRGAGGGGVVVARVRRRLEAHGPRSRRECPSARLCGRPRLSSSRTHRRPPATTCCDRAASSAPLLAALPALGVVGHSASASPGDVYDAFLTRRSRHLVGEARGRGRRWCRWASAVLARRAQLALSAVLSQVARHASRARKRARARHSSSRGTGVASGGG